MCITHANESCTASLRKWWVGCHNQKSECCIVEKKTEQTWIGDE